MVSEMELGYTIYLKIKLKVIDMKVNLRMVRLTEKVLHTIVMEINMKDYTKIGIKMGREHIISQRIRTDINS